MRELNASLAGEMSGHTFFNDRWYGFDDGLYSGVRLCEIISKQTYRISEIFDRFPENFSTPELNISVSESEKFSLIKCLQQGRYGDGKISIIDGIRVSNSSTDVMFY